MSGSKIFQSKGTVYAKAQKLRRPQSVCKGERNLGSWKPKPIGREQQEEKLESLGQYRNP